MRFVLLAAVAAALALPASGSTGSGWLITAYAPGCGASGRTATGTWPRYGTVAVDPAVIPLHSRVWVSGYGYGRALDTGPAIRGYHVDVFLSSCSAAYRFTHHGVVRYWRR